MTRSRAVSRILNPIAWALLVATATTASADEVYLHKAKDKPSYTGTVTKESSVSIKIDSFKNDIPAEEIRDIVYTIEPVSVMVNKYKPAMKAEQAAGAVKDLQARAKLYKEAIQLYEDAIQGLKGEQLHARRHLEYKIALVRWHMAQDLDQPELFKKAFASLAQYRNKHPQSWQVLQCLRFLAQWHLERKEFQEAEKVLWELSQSGANESIRFDAGLAAIDALAQGGNYKDARAQLEVMLEKQPKDSPASLRIRIALVECLGYGDKTDLAEARKLAAEVLKETKDKTLRALAYNAMGVSYVKNKLWREASWEFLWVDMIYNQDKNVHAKALYYLVMVFENLGEVDRAREWRTMLDSNLYVGTHYQRWARQ
jgi:tetratricopeptide (TPR) repeat protein